VADTERVDAVAPETVDPFATGRIAHDAAFAAPFDRGEVTGLGDRFPVGDEAGGEMPIVIDHRLRPDDRRRRLDPAQDQIQHLKRGTDGLIEKLLHTGEASIGGARLPGAPRASR
jgi:hypothetical protein